MEQIESKFKFLWLQFLYKKKNPILENHSSHKEIKYNKIESVKVKYE